MSLLNSLFRIFSLLIVLELACSLLASHSERNAPESIRLEGEVWPGRFHGPGLPEMTGIGFDLSFGYGTAAIQYRNTPSFNVAKIEGSHSYTEMMRNLSSEVIDEYAGARMVDGLFRQPSAPIYPTISGRNIKRSPFDSLRNNAQTITHQKSPIELMLDSLVSSTQSYINTTIPLPNVYITLPSRIYATERGMTNLTETFQNADIGDIGGLSMAHYLAVDSILHGIRSAARHSKPQEYTALVIDYSKEAFSTMVIGPLNSMDHWEDIQIVRYDVDFYLGYNNATDDRHFLKIKQHLEELTTLVGPQGKFFHLILMGDQASQEHFLSVADWVLHNRIERWDTKQLNTCALRDSYDPAFTGAQAAARMSLIAQWRDECHFYARRDLIITRPLSRLRLFWMEIRLSFKAYSWSLKRYLAPETGFQQGKEAERPVYLIGQ